MVQKAASLGAEDTRELRDAGCGQAVGRFTLLRRIAAGGMAEVYSAQATVEAGFSKRVAIKKILPQYSHNERFISMLVDEAKITVALDHPSIAQVHELGHDGEDYFIVMEYVDGRPLNKLMQRVDERGLGNIPIEHSCHVMSQVALGLHHAHSQVAEDGSNRNIVHRDVSPQNILLSYDGPVKLIDFGIARAEGRLNQTSAGVIKGKLRYLAPEIAAGMEPDNRADIFCCGIVLFEMLTGEAMFAPKSDLEAIDLATKAKVKSPRSRNRSVPKDLDDIVMKALKRDREDRYQTAKDLYSDLRRFLNQAYPDFVDADLGDFMQSMFSLELREDRQRDALAQRVAQQISEMPTPSPAPKPAPLKVPGLPDSQTSYKPLVTRVAIYGADGGDAMDVVPADSAPKALIHPGTLDPGTLPPKAGPGAASEAEPTLKAPNPFVVDVAGGAPTVNASAPEPRASTVAAHDALITPRVVGGGADPSLAPVPTLAGWDQRKWPLWLGGTALLLALIFAAVLLSGDPPIEPEVSTNTPIELAPIPIEETGGTLLINVSPEVPISVTVAEANRVDRMMPPVTIRGIEADDPQEITVHADGYRSITITRAVKAGQELRLELVLVAATATINLRGLKANYRVTSSLGEVEGAKITGIPADSTVQIHVARPGTSDFKTKVDITEPRPVTLEIPRPPTRARGTLTVHTRPLSTVYVDGRRRGRTPLKLRLTAGTHQVLLKGPNGRTYKTTRKVRPGRVTRFQFQW